MVCSWWLTWLVSYVLGFIRSYILLQNLIVFYEDNEFVRFSTKGCLLWSCFIFCNHLLSNFTEDTGGLRTERKWKLLSSRNVNNWNNFSPILKLILLQQNLQGLNVPTVPSHWVMSIHIWIFLKCQHSYDYYPDEKLLTNRFLMVINLYIRLVLEELTHHPTIPTLCCQITRYVYGGITQWYLF